MADRPPAAKRARPRRTSGRPVERVLSPEDVQDIGELLLRGHSQTEVAQRYGVSRRAIQNHLERTLRPQWERGADERVGELRQRVRALFETAWRCFRESQAPETHKQVKQALLDGKTDLQTVEMVAKEISRTGQVAFLDVVEWCIDWESKVDGLYRKPGEDDVASQTGNRPVAILVEVADRKEVEGAMSFADFSRRATVEARN